MTRATERGAPWLADPEPIAKMYGAFADLGGHEAHVIDTTHDVAPASVSKLFAALGTGRLRLG